VYVYAAKKPGGGKDFERAVFRPGELSTGMLVGTAKVVSCTGEPRAYELYLTSPERLVEVHEPER
jgi:hypothetical protein